MRKVSSSIIALIGERLFQGLNAVPFIAAFPVNDVYAYRSKIGRRIVLVYPRGKIHTDNRKLSQIDKCIQ